MNNRKISISKELAGLTGCLSGKKTKTARRRFSESSDEDLLVCGIDPFLIDAELKIASSKAVRRLLDKTQVLTNPRNYHVRRRITHTGEVTSLAAFISGILGLNVELARAIALGHDMGHPPFGHDGEAFLTEVSGRKFKHETMAVVIAQEIERQGEGLNLTYEVLSGFLREGLPGGWHQMSSEAAVVMHADRFAYVTGDYNDMRRIGYPIPEELSDVMGSFGVNQRAKVNTLTYALCQESAQNGAVSFSDSAVASDFEYARNLMYEIYPRLNAFNSADILRRIYGFLGRALKPADPALALALMTDQDVLYLANQPILDFSRIRQTTIFELLDLLMLKQIDWWEPDLKW